MKKNLFLLVLLFLTLFISCNKNDSSKNGQNSKKTLTQISDKLYGQCPFDCHDPRCVSYQSGYCGIQVITNSNNKFDYVGTDHNNGVAYVFNQINSSTEISFPFIQYQTNVFLSTIAIDTNAANKTISYATPQYYQLPDTLIANNPDKMLEAMVDQGMSSTCYNYLTSIFTVLNNDIGSNAPSTTLYTKFATDIINIENTAINNTTLSTIELQYVLSACSVARNSVSYWGNYQLSSSGNSDALVRSLKKQSNKFHQNNRRFNPFSWGNVAKADIAGAIGGCVSGAILGSVAGIGAGAGPGAIGGALAGGVGSSVGVAVYQVFGW